MRWTRVLPACNEIDIERMSGCRNEVSELFTIVVMEYIMNIFTVYTKFSGCRNEVSELLTIIEME